MLDHVHIIQRGGLTLWTRSFTSSPSPVGSLIRDGLIEERAEAGQWDKDGYAIKWTLANDLGLVFVVAYQRILQLNYVNDLLSAIRSTFLDLYEPMLRLIIDLSTGLTISASRKASSAYAAVRSPSNDGWASCFDGWDATFAKLLKEVESASGHKARRQQQQARLGAANADSTSPSASAETSRAQTPTNEEPSARAGDAEVIARNIAALKARHRKASARKGKGTDDSESDASRPGTPGAAGARTVKEARKWDDGKITKRDMAAFDYSADQPGQDGEDGRVKTFVDERSLGKRSKDGSYQVADYASSSTTTPGGAQPAAAASIFSRLATTIGLTGAGGAKTTVMTKDSLRPVLDAMKAQLLTKNVAREIADKICEGVATSLEGKKLDGKGGEKELRRAVKEAMERTLTRVLTPKTSTDVMAEIRAKRSAGKSDPYAMVFIGVNGVGKSTNLSKVAFWLLQNRFRVLIAACDTFRSGAVEQLRIHVRNLSGLDDPDVFSAGEGAGKVGGATIGGKVELFERGYGRDAAGIAKDAIAHAKENAFDVVLVDTAGRMQDNEPLMRALSKLISVNRPDKVVFVGEALVGNEAVDQLTRFDRSLRDFSGLGSSAARGIDGIVLTKFDTIDDKVGAALSMTYVSGAPLLFVGMGQTYSDLRTLRVNHIVDALLR